MQNNQEGEYYTSILRAGGSVKGILLRESASGGTVRLSSKTIVAEIPLTHDHRGIMPKNWRDLLYAMISSVESKRLE